MKRSLRVGSAPIFFFSVPAEKIFYVYAETQTGERRLEPSFFFCTQSKSAPSAEGATDLIARRFSAAVKREKAFFGKVPHKSRKCLLCLRAISLMAGGDCPTSSPFFACAQTIRLIKIRITNANAILKRSAFGRIFFVMRKSLIFFLAEGQTDRKPIPRSCKKQFTKCMKRFTSRLQKNAEKVTSA